jgi:hypothetical protein
MAQIRTECIICDTLLPSPIYQLPNPVFVAHYSTQTPSLNSQTVPFSICICPKCSTAQLQYLADPEEVYKHNHADSTGYLMIELHRSTHALLKSFESTITGIIEVGSAYGTLADMILNDIHVPYTIIEPTYKGSHTNKHIIPSFVEDVDPLSLTGNTLIISHVFEHFYKPKLFLEKLTQLPNLDYLVLVFPDLEYYIRNGILHVLNTEHTFYIENAFLQSWVESYGFSCIKQTPFKNHTQTFLFKRTQNRIPLTAINTTYSLEMYIHKIKETIERFNAVIDSSKVSSTEVYLWPASIHTLTLLHHGLSPCITAFADNSLNKQNTYMYGYNIPIVSFSKLISDDAPNRILLIHGGVFTPEILSQLQNLQNTKYILGE